MFAMSEFNTLRSNIIKETRQAGSRKMLIEKSGISSGGISLLLSGKRDFQQNHLEAISKALNISLSHLFQSPAQVALKSQEDEFMKEIQECLDLMVSIPEFKRGMLARCDELKITFKDKVATVKKKDVRALLK
jgi:transcriptional regulator with XRE-family HTH domain